MLRGLFVKKKHSRVENPSSNKGKKKMNLDLKKKLNYLIL